jgi:hypothetical protein
MEGKRSLLDSFHSFRPRIPLSISNPVSVPFISALLLAAGSFQNLATFDLSSRHHLDVEALLAGSLFTATLDPLIELSLVIT